MRNKRFVVPALVALGVFLGAVQSHRSAASAYADRQARRQQRMDVVIPQVQADTLFAAFDQIARQSGCAIHLDTKSLEAGSIDAKTECHVRLYDVTLAESLTVVSESYYLRTRLAWWWQGDTLCVGTADPKRVPMLRVFDVSDLTWVEDSKYLNLPTMCFGGPANNNTGGSGGGTTTGTGLFGSSAASASPDVDDSSVLATFIEEVVATDTWRSYGGTIGKISRMGGRLIITQTPENQEKIAMLLEKLRTPD